MAIRFTRGFVEDQKRGIKTGNRRERDVWERDDSFGWE